jgi:hypothetical protein
MADNTRVLWTYTTNTGQLFAIAAKSVYVTGTDAAKYGGDAPDVDVLSIPNGFRPRKVKCVDAAGSTRWITVYDPTATLWTTPGTTITLNKGGVDTVFTSTDQSIGERAERKGKNPVAA